jgi:uncharacterized membrane protein YqiK
MVKVPPDKFVVVIRKGRVRKIAFGDSVFVNPLTETYKYIPLDVRTHDIYIKDIESSEMHNRAKFNIRGRALVKVTSNEQHILGAVERLMRMTKAEIDSIALTTLEEIIRRYARQKTPYVFSRDLLEITHWIRLWANEELLPQGIEVVRFTINDIEDEYGYFEKVQHGVLDLWLWATDEDGRFIP